MEHRRRRRCNVHIFESNKVTKDELEEYVNLVWANTDHGYDTPKYFKNFSTVPSDKGELDTLRNQQRQKHIMLGNKIWNSLALHFKIEIIGSKKEYHRGQEYDGHLLWDFICRCIDPTTKVGASKLKDDIENTKPSKFDNDIIKYNTWFEDTRNAIIKEEGKGYNEYLHSMFRSYLSCEDNEFLDAIKDERRKWIQGKLLLSYSYLDLMELGRVTYNNLIDEGSWRFISKPKAKGEEKNYLALATALMTKMTSLSKDKGNLSKDKKSGERVYKTWRYENPDNEYMKEVRGGIMKWCKNY